MWAVKDYCTAIGLNGINDVGNVPLGKTAEWQDQKEKKKKKTLHYLEFQWRILTDQPGKSKVKY
jgi:hypothetical protein